MSTARLYSHPHPKGEEWGKHIPGLSDQVGPFDGNAGGGSFGGGGGARGGCLPLLLMIAATDVALVWFVGWLA